MLLQSPNFTPTEGTAQNQTLLDRIVVASHSMLSCASRLKQVCATVWKIRVPIDPNIFGTFNVMEMASRLQVKHLLMAST